MKKQILKIAGVKSEKEFYKKYPTEEAFMKVHGKAFKKAQIGAYIGGERTPSAEMINFSDIYNANDRLVTGSTQDERDYQAYLAAQQAADSKGGSGGGLGNLANLASSIGGDGTGDSEMMKLFSGGGGEGGAGLASAASAMAKRGKKVKKFQGGGNEPVLENFPDYNSWKSAHDTWESSGGNNNAIGATTTTTTGGQKVGTMTTAKAPASSPTAKGTDLSYAQQTPSEKSADTMNGIAKALGPIGGFVKAFQTLKAEKEARKAAEQMRDVSALTLQASRTRPEETQRQYIRPEDVKNTGEEFFPIYGVGTPKNPMGTNVLAKYGGRILRAQDGEEVNYDEIGGNPTEIQNTYDPNDLYGDLGYEPLSDSEQMKQYYYGGGIRRAQDGAIGERTSGFSNFITGGGGDALSGISNAAFDNAGSQFGSAAADVVGLIPGVGPVAKALAKPVLSTIGGILGGGNKRKTHKAQIATNRNLQNTSLNQGAQAVQAQYSQFVREGGNIPSAQVGKDLQKIGKCAAEEARNKEYGAMDKQAAKENRAWDKEVAAAEREAARQTARERADYISEGLTGYGDKVKRKDFEAGYQAFAAQNPELAKDRLLYTIANKELPKLHSNRDYYLRKVLNRQNPQMGYDTLSLPGLMQTMQKGYGSGEGYLQAWDKGFPQKQQDGGETSEYEWVSHTWQPQVITQFGEHKVSDLLRPPKDADMLRAGGEIRNIRHNYRNADEIALTQMSLGGQIETTWGGYAEPISQNPYMPASGQTIMFKGQSHDESDGKGRTGIGVKYGKNDSYTDYAEYGTEADADVEVERNEPAAELPGADGQNNMVVYGNLKIPDQFLHELNHPGKSKGKKFKNRVKEISEEETKLNKKIEKAVDKVNNLNVLTQFDQLSLNTQQMNLLGYNMAQKSLADDKMALANIQSAYNDTAEEMGLVADDLAKGKVKFDKNAFKNTAEFGRSIPKAQNGTTASNETISDADLARLTELYNKAKDQKHGKAVIEFQREFHRLLPKTALQYNKDTKFLTKTAKGLGLKKSDFDKIDPNNPTGSLEKKFLQGNEDEYFGPITTKYFGMAQNRVKPKDIPALVPIAPYTPTASSTIDAGTTTTLYPITPYRRSPLADALGQVLPYVRPSDTEALDTNQLAGEMFALSNNQVEPVWAQKLQPRLGVPYDISLQDILNENTASFRAAQRTIGYNPALQANLASQMYGANQKVLGEQFRLNQAEKARVYEKNRDLLNQYDLQNMAILDKQYERQAKAKSLTKATAQAALNSISDKVAKNKLENRKLAVYENLYNYRYDPKFRAINMNAPFQPTIPTVYSGPTASTSQAGNVAAVGQTPIAVGGPNTLSQIPSLATPPYVTPTVNIVPPGFTGPLQPNEVRASFADVPQEDPNAVIDDFMNYYYERSRNGSKIGQKKKSSKENRNSSIVRALKNL